MTTNRLSRAFGTAFSRMAQAARLLTFTSRPSDGTTRQSRRAQRKVPRGPETDIFSRSPSFNAAPASPRGVFPSSPTYGAAAKPLASFRDVAGVDGRFLSEAHRTMVENVLKPGSWGGEVELNGLARMLGVSIHICRVTQRSDDMYGRSKVEVYKAMNPGQSRTLFLAYDGTHYEALFDAQTADPFGIQGRGPGAVLDVSIQPTPPDGNCLYHAVAEASRHRDIVAVNNIFHMGQFAFIKGHNRLFRKIVPNADKLSHAQAYMAFRDHFANKMRVDLAKELSKPSYATMAEFYAFS